MGPDLLIERHYTFDQVTLGVYDVFREKRTFPNGNFLTKRVHMPGRLVEKPYQLIAPTLYSIQPIETFSTRVDRIR